VVRRPKTATVRIVMIFLVIVLALTEWWSRG
jgi:hypothetical protein